MFRRCWADSDLKLFAEDRVLGGDADGARVEVALAHHGAAEDDERRRAEAELVGAEQRADQHVVAGADLAVDLPTSVSSADPRQ